MEPDPGETRHVLGCSHRSQANRCRVQQRSGTQAPSRPDRSDPALAPQIDGTYAAASDDQCRLPARRDEAHSPHYSRRSNILPMDGYPTDPDQSTLVHLATVVLFCVAGTGSAALPRSGGTPCVAHGRPDWRGASRCCWRRPLLPRALQIRQLRSLTMRTRRWETWGRWRATGINGSRASGTRCTSRTATGMMRLQPVDDLSPQAQQTVARSDRYPDSLRSADCDVDGRNHARRGFAG
jgi:hypothetical protein